MHYRKPKFLYYLSSLYNMTVRKFIPFRIENEMAKLTPQQRETVMRRLDYYIQLGAIDGSSLSATVSSFKREEMTFYYLDLKQYLVAFPSENKFNYCFGDVTHVPDTPSFVKSRPIISGNQNSVLLPLDSIRHFYFVDDDLDFYEKKDAVVWRGNAWQVMENRRRFLTKFIDHPLCNVGAIKGLDDEKLCKQYMTTAEQLKYKFIVSLEGVDVATNLKWIMSSNSVAVMPEPKYETWFMEGRLIPDVHYIRINDDYSDFEERINFYLENPELCQQIVRNANEYVHGFKDLAKERLLTMMVINRYFSLIQ